MDVERKIIGYARVSVANKNIKNQETLIEEYVLNNYIRQYIDKCYEMVEDNGYSGSNMNRPGIQYIRELMRVRKVKCIVVKDISRISRNYIELAMFIKECEKTMTKVWCIVDTMDITSIDNEVQLDIGRDIKALLADFYSKDISLKTKSALDVRKKEGKYAIGRVPYGYRKRDGILCIEESEARIVRHIYKMAEIGYSISEIGKILDIKGINTPRKSMEDRKSIVNESNRKDSNRKLWSYSSLKKILSNEAYIGNMVYNRTERINWETSKRRETKEVKRYINHHKPIITKEVYDSVQNKLFNRIRNNRQ